MEFKEKIEKTTELQIGGTQDTVTAVTIFKTIFHDVLIDLILVPTNNKLKQGLRHFEPLTKDDIYQYIEFILVLYSDHTKGLQ